MPILVIQPYPVKRPDGTIFMPPVVYTQIPDNAVIPDDPQIMTVVPDGAVDLAAPPKALEPYAATPVVTPVIQPVNPNPGATPPPVTNPGAIAPGQPSDSDIKKTINTNVLPEVEEPRSPLKIILVALGIFLVVKILSK